MSTARVIVDGDSPRGKDEVRPRATGRKRARRPYLILAAFIVAALAGFLVFRAFTAGRENTDDAQVAADVVPIAARVSGTVIAVPVVDNQTVKAGDVLARIDPADYQARVRQAEAELRGAEAQAAAADAQMRIVAASSKGGLSTARAALSSSSAGVAGADAQVAAARANVERAEADAERAQADLERAQRLARGNAIPAADVDTQRTRAAAARAAVAEARAQLAAAEQAKAAARLRVGEAAGRVQQSAPVDAQVAAARANAELAAARAAQAAAALDQARLMLERTTIAAPRAGHIARLAVHMGQLVQPGQTVTDLVPNETYVVANFKETQIGPMRPGQPAEVSVDALPGRKLHARVDSISFGTGAQFSLLPPDNASGNFVKVVQRVPVKLVWTDLPPDVSLAAGLSADVTVRVR